LGLSMRLRWMTSDGSPWYLRGSSKYSQPSGDYNANCYMDITGAKSASDVTFNDNDCNYHSKSYYCQPMQFSLKPKVGSPSACTCKKVELTGEYSTGILIKCDKCLDVYRSKEKNSCPSGTKIFSPRTRADWKTFLASAQPLRNPHWIIDVTRPQNGCGGCTTHAMNSAVPAQATWVTSDRSPWWLRSTTYSQPNGDYSANCYMDLWQNPSTENAVTFDDGNCNKHSRSYYCQSLKTTTTTTTTTAPPKTTPVPKTGGIVGDHTPMWCGVSARGPNLGRASSAEACFTKCGSSCTSIEWWAGGHTSCFKCLKPEGKKSYTYTADMTYPPHVVTRKAR